MKKYGWVLIAAAAGALLLARPAMAAVTAGPTAVYQEQDAVIVSQAPPGDEGTVLSPVIVAGQGAGQGDTQRPNGADTQPPNGADAQPPNGADAQPQNGADAWQQNGTDAQPEGETAASQSPVLVQGGTAQVRQTDESQPSGAAPSSGEAQSSGESQPGGVLYPVGEQPAAGASQQAADGSGQPADASGQQGAQQAAGGRQVDPSRPMVALTFDDGPQPSVGNRIMDCLAQYGGRATFFMVGERVPAYADEVRRMVAEGHEVANHSMNHKYLQKLGAAQIQAQVTQCNDVIESVCGVRPTIMRLPGGNHNGTVLANTHMPMIQWSIDTLDWKTRNAQSTVSAVLNHVKDGDIVLMHELYSQSGDAALTMIPELVNRGYQLVTVSELAAAKGQTLQAGKLYSAFH